MRNLTPLGDRLLVRRSESDGQIGAIIVPDVAREKPQRGEVKAVGVDVHYPLKSGDFILFGRYSGSEIEVDGETLLMLRQDEVLAKYDED